MSKPAAVIPPIAAGHTAPASTSHGRMLDVFMKLVSTASPNAGCNATQTPERLAFPLSDRAKRHMRNARASWW